jgi:predicted transcriptional regulator
MLNEKIGEGPISTINYPSYEVLYKQLTPARLAVLGAMAGAGAMSIREISRRMNRDFKGVHGDVTALFRNGLLKKTAGGQMIFPYDGLRFEFDMPVASLIAAE